MVVEIVSAIVGSSALTIFITKVFEYYKDRNNVDRLSRQDTRDEFQELYRRQQREIDLLRTREDTCREELGKLWRKFERMSERLSHYEEQMIEAGLLSKPWVENGTGETPNLGAA